MSDLTPVQIHLLLRVARSGGGCTTYYASGRMLNTRNARGELHRLAKLGFVEDAKPKWAHTCDWRVTDAGYALAQKLN
jgi:hypothetical protein